MPNPVVGTMVFCVSCKAVIWAHDADHGDVRGICNMFRLACPLCGAVANFDGFRPHQSELENWDVWAWMRGMAEYRGLAWRNSPDMSWDAPRPVPDAA